MSQVGRRTGSSSKNPNAPAVKRDVRQIELFELYKAEHGMGMPYDSERVAELRHMLRDARKRKLSGGLAARRRPPSDAR
jgi:hypothetical protein